MKKFAFSVVLIFLAIFLFVKTTSDYDKILKGDLSAFAGYWINGEGGRFFLAPDGTSSITSKAKAYDFRKGDGSGHYSWNVAEEFGGYWVAIYPAGFVFSEFHSDETKVRLYAGHDFYPWDQMPDKIFYKESKFPATHITTENLRLRTDQDLNSSTIKILGKGTKVLIREWGTEITIEGTSAKWAYVYTSDGLAGWCYSGYLKELQE
jgi:hypothetical protein